MTDGHRLQRSHFPRKTSVHHPRECNHPSPWPRLSRLDKSRRPSIDVFMIRSSCCSSTASSSWRYARVLKSKKLFQEISLVRQFAITFLGLIGSNPQFEGGFRRLLPVPGLPASHPDRSEFFCHKRYTLFSLFSELAKGSDQPADKEALSARR